MGRVRLERALIGALALEHATIGVSRHRYAGLAIASEEDDEEPERPKERVVVTKRARCQARQHHEDAAIAHPDVDPAHAHVGGAIDLSAIRRRKSTPRPHREAKAAHEAGELRTAAVVVATGVGQAQVHLIQAVHVQGALTPALSAVRPPLGDRDGPSAWIAGARDGVAVKPPVAAPTASTAIVRYPTPTTTDASPAAADRRKRWTQGRAEHRACSVTGG
jgi:hypothetical protein